MLASYIFCAAQCILQLCPGRMYEPQDIRYIENYKLLCLSYCYVGFA
jgi:hypothetical protein